MTNGFKSISTELCSKTPRHPDSLLHRQGFLMRESEKVTQKASVNLEINLLWEYKVTGMKDTAQQSVVDSWTSALQRACSDVVKHPHVVR